MTARNSDQAGPWRRRLWLHLFVVVFAGGGGCRGTAAPQRETFGVSGHVNVRPGEPASDGLVEFKSRLEPGLMTVGQIQSDGSFSLATRVAGQALAGAIAGLHDVRVSVTLADPQGVQGIPKTFVIPEPLLIEPGDAYVLEIDLSGPRIQRLN